MKIKKADIRDLVSNFEKSCTDQKIWWECICWQSKSLLQ